MRFSAPKIASLVALGLVIACSAAPHDEPYGSTASPVLTCGPGEHVVCTSEGQYGQPVCGCSTPACTLLSFPSPGPSAYIAAWATVTTGGGCPSIPAAHGAWAEIGTVTPPAGLKGFDGVPTDTSASSPACTSAFPGVSCCTYVWWPDGFSADDSTWSSLPKQEPAALCTPTTTERAPLWQMDACAFSCHDTSECSTCLRQP